MSTRANLTATLAGLGVLALGWSIGTDGGTTLGGVSSSTTAELPTTTTASVEPDTESLRTSEADDPDDEDLDDDSGDDDSGDDGGAAGDGTVASSSPTAVTGAYVDGTYTGQTVSHRFGSVTVTVTISGGTLSALQPTVVSDGDRHSERINSSAIPVLEAEVVAANSAEVSTISGATYTTQAYLQSLQSALDQAR